MLVFYVTVNQSYFKPNLEQKVGLVSIKLTSRRLNKPIVWVQGTMYQYLIQYDYNPILRPFRYFV